MNFIHIADLHLGMQPDSGKPWSEQRGLELFQSFERVIRYCNEKSIDLLLIAGDLFHRQPLIRELKEVNYYFSLLNHTKVVFIAGNHDYIGLRSNYPSFSFADHVMFLKEEIPQSVFLEELNTEVHGLSYHSRDICEAKYQDVILEPSGRIHLLLLHGGDPKNIPIDKKQLSKSGFDYIALGHIHKPERLSERMAYAGSLEPLDKNELGIHGFVRGEIDKEGTVSTCHINFVNFSIREYKVLDLPVTAQDTNASLTGYIKREMETLGLNHLYRISFNGFRDPVLTIDTNSIYNLGNIVEVEDETVPDYDFDTLMEENRNNIIGM